MRLRTSLFFSFFAVISFALLGLGMALASIVQLSQHQEFLAKEHFLTIEFSQNLRQHLDDHISNQLRVVADPKQKEQLEHKLTQLLKGAQTQSFAQHMQEQLASLTGNLNTYLKYAERASNQPLPLPPSQANALRTAYLALQDNLQEIEKHALSNLNLEQGQTDNRVVLVILFLAWTAACVLLVGYFLASKLSKTFSQPIEALAKAADQISYGDFDISLPTSTLDEMYSLNLRFRSMAESLQHFKSTDVEALSAGQERLQAVLDSIDDGLMILDSQGRLQHLNPVAKRQLACDDTAIGKSPGEVLDKVALNEQLQRLLASDPFEQAVDDLSLQSQGEQRLLTYNMTPIHQSHGDISGAVIILRDVTEQRALEQLRSEFVLRASHELRTPMTGMHMAVSLLQERIHFDPQSREQDLLNTIEGEMQRLMLLSSELLNFSRYQNGLQKLDLRLCHIEPLLNASAAFFNEQIQANKLSLELSIPEDLPPLTLDPDLIQRVMEHLLTNAIRHSHAGDRIRVYARQQHEKMVISVEDSGEGIAFSQQSRIFEPFVQFSRKKSGMGLGLALCKEIIHLHNGQINVYSKPGQGTRFYFTLPLTHLNQPQRAI